MIDLQEIVPPSEGAIEVEDPRCFTSLAKICLNELAAAVACRASAGVVRRYEGRWFLFSGRIFDPLDDEAMGAKVRPILDRCFSVVRSKNEDEGERHVPLNPTSWTVRETLTAMLPLLPPSEGAPDQNRDELIVENGRLQLVSGELLPHSPSAWTTRVAPVAMPEPSPELDEAAARWRECLERLKLDATTLAYMHRALGYALTGRGTEKAFFFIHGEKDTGKSTLVRLAMNVLGKGGRGYATETGATPWLHTPYASASHTDDLMGIEGARLVFVDETPDGARFNEARVKRVTAGAGSCERLSAKGEKGRTVPIQFALFFASNYRVVTQDAATINRMRLVRFTEVLDAPDSGFEARFMTPVMRQAVLLWLVEGARAYIASGLGAEPVSVVAERGMFEDDYDWLRVAFLELVGRPRPSYRGEPGQRSLKATELTAALNRWLKEQGLRCSVPPANQLVDRVRKFMPHVETARIHRALHLKQLALKASEAGWDDSVVDIDLDAELEAAAALKKAVGRIREGNQDEPAKTVAWLVPLRNGSESQQNVNQNEPGEPKC